MYIYTFGTGFFWASILFFLIKFLLLLFSLEWFFKRFNWLNRSCNSSIIFNSAAFATDCLGVAIPETILDGILDSLGEAYSIINQ